jgi:DNA-binding response OmpR family regulator
MMKEPINPVRLLIVEDNPSDVVFLRYALESDTSWPTEAEFIEDGEAAIDHVLERQSSPAEEMPDLIIMDLNLPKRDGIEVIKVIRSCKAWQNVPVVVFSSSPEQVSKVNLGKANLEADCLVTKPFDIEEYLQITQVFRRCYERTRLARV